MTKCLENIEKINLVYKNFLRSVIMWIRIGGITMEHMMRVYRTSQHVTQGWWGRFCGKADYDVPTICVDVCVLGDKPDSYYEELTNYDKVLLHYLVNMFREDSFPIVIVDGAVSVLRQELSKESQAFIDEQNIVYWY